jgi:hypothetical protein
MWLKKNERKKLSYYVLLNILTKRNSRPGVQREGKLGGNQSGVLQS